MTPDSCWLQLNSAAYRVASVGAIVGIAEVGFLLGCNVGWNDGAGGLVGDNVGERVGVVGAEVDGAGVGTSAGASEGWLVVLPVEE